MLQIKLTYHVEGKTASKRPLGDVAALRYSAAQLTDYYPKYKWARDDWMAQKWAGGQGGQGGQGGHPEARSQGWAKQFAEKMGHRNSH